MLLLDGYTSAIRLVLSYWLLDVSMAGSDSVDVPALAVGAAEALMRPVCAAGWKRCSRVCDQTRNNRELT